MDSKILLIKGDSSRRWVDAVIQATGKIDKSLEVIGLIDLARITSWSKYILILIDASIPGNLATVIQQIHSQSPDARIVVFTSAPGWKEAKEVLLAGAIDYNRKSLREEDILLTIKRDLFCLPFREIKEP